jgi:trehalose 2-sulfotransferase
VLAAMLPRGGPRHIIYLRRRDLLAQTISYARAVMTGVWRKEQEASTSGSLDYSQEQLESAERGIVFQQNVWCRMFNDLRIDPLCIWHEDVLADPAAASRQVADYIGVSIEPASAVQIPQISKQSRGEAEAWMDRYSKARRP